MLQIIITFIVLFITPFASANYTITLGGITYHVFDPSAAKYTNKISSDGRLISNKIIGIGYASSNGYTFDNEVAFIGENSISKPIAGVIYERGFVIDSSELGIAAGGYLQQDSEFRKLNLIPFSVSLLGDIGLAPILGVAYNYEINKRIKLNNIISPVIYNLSVSINF